MANFSVEFLSKSSYEEMTLHAGNTVLRSKVHCEIEEFAKESRSQYSPTSPNSSCGCASGSESERADDSEGEATQQRRSRTKFTSQQTSKLENTFSRHKYLGATQRRKIAEKLNLSETQVKTWFQNRRMKLKREVQDMRPEFLPPVQFQHPFMSGQLPSRGAFHWTPSLPPLPLLPLLLCSSIAPTLPPCTTTLPLNSPKASSSLLPSTI